MTQTDVVASVRPQANDAAPTTRRSPRASRRLLALPVALLLTVALVVPTTAFAATTSTPTSGYNQTPPTPASGTSPSKEKSTPKKETAPAKATTTPTTTTTAKASTLPFTGFDLRWTVGLGLLLMGAGFSIVTVQRRQRRDGGS
jgi:hypothetical protein